MKTTLNKIKEHELCKDGWEKLLKHLGKTEGDNEPLSLITILDSNGLDDAIWCLRAVDGHEREMRLFSVWCARQVQHLMTEPSIAALDTAERYANGLATKADLTTAWAAAGAAAWAADATVRAAWAAWAARAAAGDAAGAAARASQEVEFRRICNETKGVQDDTR